VNQIRYARFKSTIDFVKRRREIVAFEDMLSEIVATRGPRAGLRFIGAMVADGYIPRLDGIRLVDWVIEVCVVKTPAATSTSATMPV
jgi:hypothetical protein